MSTTSQLLQLQRLDTVRRPLQITEFARRVWTFDSSGASGTLVDPVYRQLRGLLRRGRLPCTRVEP